MLTNMKHTGNHLDTGNYSSESGHPSDIVIITLPIDYLDYVSGIGNGIT